MGIKLDIKSIVILVLLGVCILFFGMWFFKGSDTKDRIKQLEQDNKKIELVRDSLKNANVALQVDFDKKQKDIDDRDNKIKQIESDIAQAKRELVVANNKVIQSQKDLAATKKKIDDLNRNPIKRDGDSLINSLKEKLNH